MKIWLDLINSLQVNFFAPMIAELKVHHDLVITCRPLANTIDLLDIHDFKYQVAGRHYRNGDLLAEGRQAHQLILNVLRERPISAAAVGRGLS